MHFPRAKACSKLGPPSILQSAIAVLGAFFRSFILHLFAFYRYSFQFAQFLQPTLVPSLPPLIAAAELRRGVVRGCFVS